MSTALPPYSYKDSLKSDISDEPVNVWLQRPIAGLVTRAVFSYPITPNQLTVVAVLFGIAGGVLLSGEHSQLRAAAVCFYLKDIFDSADGQLARAKQLYSRRGRFLDSIGDFVVNLSLFIGVFIVLQKDGVAPYAALALSVVGFLGVSLRVSYHVFYQTSFLHSQNEYQTNRIAEDLQEQDYENDRLTVSLQKTFLFLYGWQDRLMQRLDTWSRRKVPSTFGSERAQWHADAAGLRLGGFLGIGTEYVLLTTSLLLGSVWLYLIFSLIVLNGVWIMTIFYRRSVLAERIRGARKEE